MADATVTWASSAADVAPIDDTGKVTGKAEGDTKITATISGVTSEPLDLKVVAAKVAVTGVKLDKDKYAVNTGATVKAVATVSPDNATDKSAAWKSDTEAVATVASDGTIKGVKAGKANVTVTTTDGAKTATAEVDVSDPVVAVTGVTLDKKDYPVKVGATIKAVATVAPDGATDKSVTWSSSDETVAKVGTDGTITGVKASDTPATITVTTTDGKKTATATATVSAA